MPTSKSVAGWLMSRTAAMFALVCISLFAIAIAVLLADLKVKETLLVLAALSTIPLMAITRRPKAVALIGWILSLTYFRVFYPIDSMAGFQGFFTSASDVFLIALALIWLWQSTVSKRPLAAPTTLWPLAVPFLVVCVLSSAMAQRSDWAAYEAVRVLKLVFILLFCRFNLDATAWWACVAGFGFAIVAQSAYGIIQVTTRLGRYQLADYESYRRAGGTLGHANLLACYLLLLSPAFLALAMTARTRSTRMLCGAVGLIGMAGVTVTISRAPWLIALIEMTALAIVFLFNGALRLKTAIGALAISIVTVAVVLAPFHGWIESRMRRDLKESVDFRLKLNEAAFDIFLQHPFLGIGLNNFPLYLLPYDLPFHDSLTRALATGREQTEEEQPIEGLATASGKGSRWMWVPHNLYFLLLAETGIFGLASFLLLTGASVAKAFRAASLPGEWGGASLGLLVGMCGVLVYMLVDFAMWLDPVLYMFTLVAGLVAAAPSLAKRTRVRAPSEARWFRKSGVLAAAIGVPLLFTSACASRGAALPAELPASLNVDCGKILKNVPRELYGANVDWVYDASGLWDPGKAAFRPAMIDAVEKLRPQSLLFPAGISADFYHWRDGIGPAASRPPRGHGSDPGTSKNGFGTDEFLSLCRRSGATPILLVNAVTGTPSEAADWVAYCNSPRRPNAVRNWIVGNEPYMKGYSDAQKKGYLPAQDFATRYLSYARAMRKADPGIRLFAPAGQNFGRYGVVDDNDWDKILLERASPEIDYLSVHNAYAPVMSGNAPMEEVYQAMFAFHEQLRKNLRTLNEHIDNYAQARAKQIKLAVTEWGPFFVPSKSEHYLGHTKTLGSALFAASALQVFLQSDRVEIANFFKLTDPSFQGLIAFDGVPKATYYAIQIFTSHFGNLLVASTAQSPLFNSKAVGMVDEAKQVPYFTSVASLAEDRSRLYILSVNRHFSSSMRVKANIRAFQGRDAGTLWTLTAPSADANNGEDLPRIAGITWPKPATAPRNSMFYAGKPDTVVIRKSAVSGISENFEFVVPPLSVTSLELERG